MAKSNNYSGLNPVVIQALNNLQYRYSGEMPEIQCSRIRYPFKTLLKNNFSDQNNNDDEYVH